MSESKATQGKRLRATRQLDYSLVISFSQLREQKRTLVELQAALRCSATEANSATVEQQGEDIDGILGLIDAIQDQAVDRHGLPEKDVFRFPTIPTNRRKALR